MLKKWMLYLSFYNFSFISTYAANDPKNADIIWTSLQVDNEVKNALGLTDCQYVNQFPFEACLVMKHHLAETIHKVSKLYLVLNF